MKLPKGSRLLVWTTVLLSFALSAYLKDPTSVTVVVPFGLGLYANKQFQERKNNGK